ncbi:hypothetical protein ERS140254_00740 [Staphylococcus argenteus]|nr:hypothetical protein ERS140254_00740 [Staphylococcus argenteus]SGW61707.1 Uncharacterised protein [Staphylococcus argenteus]SGW80558.1 Uncharacterised protein [Staphylococcus argenteus]SGW88519.1 Uncharacterised protein [Staphylococcus argenteus]SGX32376.1 Uncharacterised protein [Staphylococcus argenteus]
MTREEDHVVLSLSYKWLDYMKMVNLGMKLCTSMI